MYMWDFVFQDSKANKDNPTKGRYIIPMFRLAQLIKKNKITTIIFFWYLLLYRIFVEYFMCVELSWNTQVGPNFKLWHGSGLVIHPKTRIGANCNIRHCTTIGVKADGMGNFTDDAPLIGNNVDIGSNSVIIGNITIGDFATIGAGSVVVKDVPAYSVAVGNPAKVIKVNGSVII